MPLPVKRAGCEEADKCCVCAPLRTGFIILAVYAIVQIGLAVYSNYKVMKNIDDNYKELIGTDIYNKYKLLNNIEMYTRIVLQAVSLAFYVIWFITKDRRHIVFAQIVQIISIILDYSIAMGASNSFKNQMSSKTDFISDIP